MEGKLFQSFNQFFGGNDCDLLLRAEYVYVRREFMLLTTHETPKKKLREREKKTAVSIVLTCTILQGNFVNFL